MISCVVGEVWDSNWREGSLLARLDGDSTTSITIFHNANASDPSILKPVSNDITSASAVLCDTAVCLSHAHEMGTKV